MAIVNHDEIDLLTVGGIRHDVRDSFTRAMLGAEEDTDVCTEKRYAGDYIILKSDRNIYRVTTVVNRGDIYTPGVNIERRTLGSGMKYLEDQSAEAVEHIVGNYEPTGYATKKYLAGDRVILPYGTAPMVGLYFKVTTTVNIGVKFVEGTNCVRETNSVSSLIKNIEDNKQDKPVVLTSMLYAGSTTLSFTNSAITNDAIIDIYTNKFGFGPSSVTQSGSTVTLTFRAAQSTNTQVKLVILKGV